MLMYLLQFLFEGESPMNSLAEENNRALAILETVTPVLIMTMKDNQGKVKIKNNVLKRKNFAVPG